MEFIQNTFGFLWEFASQITWQQMVMWLIGGVLVFLAIKKEMEPTLLLPMGFGTILVNLPFSGAIGEFFEGQLISCLRKSGCNGKCIGFEN